MRARYRRGIVFTILGGVVALVLLGSQRNPSSAPSVSSVSPPAQAQAKAGMSESKDQSQSGSLVLQERVALNDPLGALFGAQSRQPTSPQIAVSRPAPSAPSMPYRFAGRVIHGGKLQVFVTKGGAAIPISQGDTLERTYRVESIDADRITLVYLPFNQRQSIPMTSASRTEGASVPVNTANENAPLGGASRMAIGTIPAAVLINPSQGGE
jgi:hypothetical protein